MYTALKRLNRATAYRLIEISKNDNLPQCHGAGLLPRRCVILLLVGAGFLGRLWFRCRG